MMSSAAALLWSIAGLAGWAVAFTLVYALHGIGCARGWHEMVVAGMTLQRAALAGTSLACLLALLWLVRRVRLRFAAGSAAPGGPLLARIACSSAWSGVAATAFTLAAVLTTSVCR